MNMNSASFNGFHRFPLVSYELHKMETAENRAVGGFQPYGFLVSSFFLLFKRKEKERRTGERREGIAVFIETRKPGPSNPCGC